MEMKHVNVSVYSGRLTAHRAGGPAGLHWIATPFELALNRRLVFARIAAPKA